MFVLEPQRLEANPVHYRIVVRGHLHAKWSDWFGGLTIHSEGTPDSPATTVLTGTLKDQAALRGVLNKLWDLNLVLVSVQQLPASPSDPDDPDGTSEGETQNETPIDPALG